MEGRTHRPVIDHSKCSPCSICRGGCPAESITEMRNEEASLRGKIHRATTKLIGPRTTEKNNLPPCQVGCPLNQDISGYVKLIARKRFSEALKLIRKTNPLPSICGFVCRHPCQDFCLKNFIDKPVAIRSLKNFAANYDEIVAPKVSMKKNNGIKVAIVGSGPAGLTAAHELALKGYRAEIIEAGRRPGGMLDWAIPDFRLPREALKRDVNYIKSMGVRIRTGIRFGKDIYLDDLKSEGARAVIIAAGTMKSVGLNIDGEESCEDCFDCLSLFRSISHWRKILPGKKVLVIGGGNAALDAARTAVRLEAESVEIIYRRILKEMPADKDEIKASLDEGVRIRFLTAPAKARISAGKLNGLQCVKTKLVDSGSSKCSSPVAITGSEFDIKADIVISAVGQLADYDEVGRGMGIDLKPEKIPDSENLMFKGFEGVFGTGDFINGPTTVVEAMAAAKRTAGEADRYLRSLRDIAEKA